MKPEPENAKSEARSLSLEFENGLTLNGTLYLPDSHTKLFIRRKETKWKSAVVYMHMYMHMYQGNGEQTDISENGKKTLTALGLEPKTSGLPY